MTVRAHVARLQLRKNAGDPCRPSRGVTASDAGRVYRNSVACASWRLGAGRVDVYDHGCRTRSGNNCSYGSSLGQGLTIPDGAEEAVDLRIKRFENGSEQATVWLGRPRVPADLPLQGELYGISDLDSFFAAIHEGAAALEEPLRRVKDGERVPPWFPEEAFRALYTAGKSLRPDEQSSVRALRVPQDDPAGEFVWHPDRGHTLSIALRRATRNGNCYVRR